MTHTLFDIGLCLAAVGSTLWVSWRFFLYVRLALTEKGDTCIHEVGHALLFAPWVERLDPKVRVTMSATHHELPYDLLVSPANRPWLMLVCLAGRAAEIVGGRNGELLRDAGYVRMLDRLSAEDSDGRRWMRLATEELQLGAAAGTREGRQLLESRRHADMASLVEFFGVNRRLLETTAQRLLSEGALEPDACAQLLRQVVFTGHISRGLVATVPAAGESLGMSCVSSE